MSVWSARRFLRTVAAKLLARPLIWAAAHAVGFRKPIPEIVLREGHLPHLGTRALVFSTEVGLASVRFPLTHAILSLVARCARGAIPALFFDAHTWHGGSSNLSVLPLWQQVIQSGSQWHVRLTVRLPFWGHAIVALIAPLARRPCAEHRHQNRKRKWGG